MKKTELKTLVINQIKNARSINNLIEKLDLKSGGGIIKNIKEIIFEEKLDISHFGGKIVKEKKYKEEIKKCPICNSDFINKIGHKKQKKYCSIPCSNKDRIVTDETRNKISSTILKNNKLFDLSKKYGEKTIGLAVDLRLSGKTYEETMLITNMTKDDTILLFKINNLSFAINNLKVRNLDKDNVTKLYLEIKSIKKVAKLLKVSAWSIRKYISDNNLIERKESKTKSQSVIDWRKRQKIKLVEYKGGKCQCCSYNKSIAALQFHHIDPKEKDFTIGGKSYSFDRLKKEVDKCILVCSNCHIEIHEEIREFGISEKINKILK